MCFDTAIILNREDHISYYNKGVLRVEINKYEEAKRYYEVGLKLRPDNLKLKSNLAEVYLLVNEYDDCRTLAKEVLIPTEGQKYEFAMRILIIASLYLDNNSNDARKLLINLLNYYEYITDKDTKAVDLSLTDWKFDKFSKMIEEANLSSHIRTILMLLVALTEVNTPEDKKTVLENIKKHIEIAEDDGLDIKVDNKSSVIKAMVGWYEWTIYIKASESLLFSIKYVKYTLHPTFKEPICIIHDRTGGLTGADVKLNVQALYSKMLVISTNNDDFVYKKQRNSPDYFYISHRV